MILVIGNGESRKDIDLNRVNLAKVGCNAIYRDFKVDHLICVDKRMVEEAVRAKYNQHSRIYTREDWFDSYYVNEKNVRIVPGLPYSSYERWDLPWHWGAGPYAVLLGATKSTTVHLLGFDLHSKDQFTNNIYKDTTNYNVADKKAVDPSYWIHQIETIFDHFTKTKFITHQEDDWALPEEWKKSNVMVDKLTNLYYN
jgi:hypothetical protein